MIVTTKAGSRFLVDTDAKTITVRKMDKVSRGSYYYLRLRLGEPMEFICPAAGYIATSRVVSIEEER
jgi:hypothetical protein